MKKPTVIQFPINNICNSRCQMCDIWKQEKGHEISPSELRKIISDPVFSAVKSVGMNGGEPTLREDLSELANELCNGLPSLRQISLITNGLKPKLVTQRVAELYAVTKSAGVKLDIMLSLDGIHDVHDRVRGRRGNFVAVEECLSYFRLNNIGDSHRLGCTLISENIEDAERLMLWAEQQNIYCRFRVGIPHQRLYTKDKTEPFTLTDKQRFHLCNFLDTVISRYEKDNPARRLFLKNLRNQIIYGLPRVNGCNWQDEGVTLLSDGGFGYCAVESPTLGNLLMNNCTPSSLYLEGEPIRKNIINDKCDYCLHDYEGKPPKMKERLILKTSKVIDKFNLPRKPFRILNQSLQLARNSVKLLPQYKSYNNKAKNQSGQNKILVVGWYGTETLGDKAILYSIIQELEDAGISCKEIVVASIEPYVTINTLREFRADSNCSVISLVEAEQKAKIGHFSQVIFGGGPIMSSISYLCDISSIFQSVQKSGGQCIVWGCGLGPIRSKKRDLVNKLAISKILNHSDICIFRDQKSLDIAKQIAGAGIDKSSTIALDPAFHWARSQARRVNKPDGVGFAVRELPINEYFSDLSSDLGGIVDDFNFSIKSIMRHHAETERVYLQCMHRLPCGGDDRLYYSDILGEEITKYDFSFEHKAPSEDIEALLGLKRLYGMRFHSVVFAIALNIPVIPIDYTNGGKIASLCKLLNIHYWTPSELINHVQKGLSLPDPQCVDAELLNRYASESKVIYSCLAQRVSNFIGK